MTIHKLQGAKRGLLTSIVWYFCSVVVMQHGRSEPLSRVTGCPDSRRRRQPVLRDSGGSEEERSARRLSTWRFFYFFYFLFLFSKFIEIYSAAPLSGGRDLVAPLRGGRGFCIKTFAKIFARKSLGAGRPAAGRPALAARLQGDRLSHPYIRVGWSPTPHLHH